MMAASGRNSIILGYLGYVEIPNHGFVGGYLLVNDRARPVEFHCTAPVCPSRTQEILYGLTLRSALLCDQIGEALVKKSNRSPSLLLTDEPEAMALREATDVPLALLVARESQRNLPDAETRWWFQHDSCLVTHATGFSQDQSVIGQTLQLVDAAWDLTEPLDRIRAAVDEAQRAAA